MALLAKAVAPTPGLSGGEIYKSNPWWKAKKWSIQICDKLIRTIEDDDETIRFTTSFKDKYSVPVQDVILKELAHLSTGAYLPPRVIAYGFMFLTKS